MPSPAIACASVPPLPPAAAHLSRPALRLDGDLDALLTGLRQDVAWLDRCLAEQAGGSEDEVRTLRMQMRIRCDGMGEQLARVAGHLERLAARPPGDGAAESAPPVR